MKSSFLKFVFVLILALFPSISSAQVPGQPANSWVYGANWYCNDGFQKAGNQCVSIFASIGGRQPANSWVYKTNWYCNDGFQKAGNQCVSIFASIGGRQPANSWVYKTNWYCNDGFQKAGNQCVSIFGGSSNSGYSSAKSSPNPVYQSQPIAPSCAENGSCYGDVSANTGRAKTVPVQGYYRKDGTYVRGHYRSKPQ